MLRFGRYLTIAALSLSTIALTPVVASAATTSSPALALLENSTVTANQNGTYEIHLPDGKSFAIEPTGSIGRITYTTSVQSGHFYITVKYPNGKTTTIDPPFIMD